MAAALRAGLPLAPPLQGDGAGDPPPGAKPSLFLAGLQRHRSTSAAATLANVAPPTTAQTRWQLFGDVGPAPPPAAPAAAPGSPIKPQPVLGPLQPLLHILGALQRSPQQPALQHAPPPPAAEPAAHQQGHWQAANGPSPVVPHQRLAAEPLLPTAKSPAQEAAKSPAAGMASVLEEVQLLLSMHSEQADPKPELPTPAQLQPPPAPARHSLQKSRSGSRSGARARGGGASQAGVSASNGTPGEEAAAGMEGSGPLRRTSSRRRARSSAGAATANSSPAFTAPPGGATVTTGHAIPERRGSWPGAGHAQLGSPRGLSFAPTAFTTSPNPCGGPVRIVAAEPSAPAAAATAAAAASDHQANDTWAVSCGNGAPAAGAGGSVPPLFVAGQSRRPFRCVLGGILSFESPGERKFAARAQTKGHC